VKTYTKEEKLYADLVLLASSQDFAKGWRDERAQAFSFCFGATQVIVYSKHFEEAAEEACGWIHDNQPGKCVSESQLKELYDEAYAELAGITDDEERVSRAHEKATEDLSYFDPGIYIASYEWTGGECDRSDILAAIKECNDRGRVFIVE
jgi:hypothetical protein